MADEVTNKVFEIIKDVFARPDLQLSADTTAADVEGWDSFSHMSLVMQVEDEFGVAFETKEIGRMGRVGDLIDLIRSKLGGQ